MFALLAKPLAYILGQTALVPLANSLATILGRTVVALFVKRLAHTYGRKVAVQTVKWSARTTEQCLVRVRFVKRLSGITSRLW